VTVTIRRSFTIAGDGDPREHRHGTGGLSRDQATAHAAVRRDAALPAMQDAAAGAGNMMPAILLAVVGVLVVVNLVNNRFAPRAYVLTSLLATGLLLALFRWAGFGWSDAGLAAGAAGRGAVWGLACVVVVASGCLLAARLPVARDALADRRVAHAGPAEVAYQVLVRIPFGTVVLEEVAFRGVLYGLLLAVHGPLVAAAVSSVLFGMWHVLPALPMTRLNPAAGRAFGGRPALAVAAAVVATTVAGLLMCELRRRSGSLLAPMALHWAVNGLGYLTAWSAQRTRTA
jgi:membrane protease YdiL (CAAX protease family)